MIGWILYDRVEWIYVGIRGKGEKFEGDGVE